VLKLFALFLVLYSDIALGQTRMTWAQMKSMVDQKSIPIQELDHGDRYTLEISDGSFVGVVEIDKNDPNEDADQTDYETNYQSNANNNIQIPANVGTQVDDQGTPLFRQKFAPKGWTYNMKAFEFETCVIASLYEKDKDGNTVGEIINFKVYDAAGVELTTQVAADASCVETRFRFSPTFDYELIGGHMSRLSLINDDLRVFVTAVPDIPANMGGSLPMVRGVNLRYYDVLDVYGETTKRLDYNGGMGTNVLEFSIQSPTIASKQKFMIVMRLYK